MTKRVLIIGSGVVGGATGKGFAALGNDVVFHDVKEDILAGYRQQGYKTTGNYNLNDHDVSFVAVDTPTCNDRMVCKNLHRALEKLGTELADTRNYHVVVIRCTMPPGTVEEKVIPFLEFYSGKKAGRDFGVAVNPEFLRAVSSEQDFLNPWLIVIGAIDKRAEKVMKELYQPYKDIIETVKIHEAEIMKYVHNLYNATKISFFNEMHMVCRSLDIDADRIAGLVSRSAEAMWNPQYGIKGGRPYGGTCLPKDTRAFRSFARNLGINEMVLLDAVIKVNEEMGEMAEVSDVWMPEPVPVTATNTPAPSFLAV
jgi:UDPglucose 6-dehydrogenase